MICSQPITNIHVEFNIGIVEGTHGRNKLLKLNQARNFSNHTRRQVQNTFWQHTPISGMLSSGNFYYLFYWSPVTHILLIVPWYFGGVTCHGVKMQRKLDSLFNSLLRLTWERTSKRCELPICNSNPPSEWPSPSASNAENNICCSKFQ